MANATACTSKENIDRSAKKAMDLVEKLLKAQKPPQDLELDLKEVKKYLEYIAMDPHGGGPGVFNHGG